MSNNPISFIDLSRQAFKLLSPGQRAGAARNVCYALLIALFEVISLAVAIPVFYKLITASEETITLSAMTFTLVLPWSAVLVSIIVLFLAKNFASVKLSQKQQQFANMLYISFVERLYEQFFHQSYTTYLRQNTAETFRKIKNTAFEFTSNIILNYFTIMADVLICSFVTVILLLYDFRILFIVLVLSTPVTVFYIYFRKRVIAPLDQSFRKLTPEATVALMQGIDSFAEAQVYNKKKHFIERFINISKVTTGLLAELKVKSAIPTRLFETTAIICFCGVVIYGKYTASGGTQMLVFLALLSVVLYRVVPSLSRIFTSLSQIQAYGYSVSELADLLAPSKMKTTEARQTSLSFQHTITFENVSFNYTGGTALLNNINFEIRKGDFIVVEGASGSGKTTLLNLLAGLITDYSGKIFIDNQELSPENIRSWQEKIGIVPQAPVILQDTLLHNIAFGDDTLSIDIPRATKAANFAGLEEFISTLPLKLNTPVSENGLTLSGGQRQRIALARALYLDPDILLLDEVTNQLDDEAKLIVLNGLENLCKQGKTVILATHDSAALAFAERVFHVKHQHVYEKGALKI